MEPGDRGKGITRAGQAKGEEKAGAKEKDHGTEEETRKKKIRETEEVRKEEIDVSS